MSEIEIRTVLEKEWSKQEWYDEGQIASKLNISKRTVRNWRIQGKLKMMLNPIWKAKGQWIIELLVQRNLTAY